MLPLNCSNATSTYAKRRSPKRPPNLFSLAAIFGMVAMPFLSRGVWFSPKLSYHRIISLAVYLPIFYFSFYQKTNLHCYCLLLYWSCRVETEDVQNQLLIIYQGVHITYFTRNVTTAWFDIKMFIVYNRNLNQYIHHTLAHFWQLVDLILMKSAHMALAALTIF